MKAGEIRAGASWARSNPKPSASRRLAEQRRASGAGMARSALIVAAGAPAIYIVMRLIGAIVK